VSRTQSSPTRKRGTLPGDEGASRASRTIQNRARGAVSAWPLVAALAMAATCRADDTTPAAATGSDSSSTSTSAPAPARRPIPRPRAWSQDPEPSNSAPAQEPATPTNGNIVPVAQITPEAAPAENASPAASVLSNTVQSAPADEAPGEKQAASEVATQGLSLSKPPSAALVEAFGQATESEPPSTDFLATQSKTDGEVAQAGCPTCGGFHTVADGPIFHEALGCADGNCIPGRKPCYPPPGECSTVWGAFCQNLYQCLCCPDPCYQPAWVPAANASLFADYARPRTVTRLRYDNLEAMTRPDRNQFFISGVVPTRSNSRTITNFRARLQQFYVYQEAAGARGSFFIEYPYRQINQSWAPTQAGFGDLNFGIKSLLFDCEMLQVTFQFRTYTPTGNAMLNLGTGHFSLDPSILTSLKLGPSTYFQGQFGNWIPLLGNNSLAGGVFYSLLSLNQVLWYPTPDSPLIGTLEMDAWSFQNGGYTSALAPGMKSVYVEKGGGVSYFNIGPGLRQSICNRVDVGGALTWATSTQHWAQPWFRFEARFLF
jgi:hypothetical protein